MGDYVNSQTTKFDKSMISCGVLEAHHLPAQSAQKTLFQIANHLYHKANPRPAAYVIFSDVVEANDGRGLLLAAYIKEREAILGRLWASEARINPKTGNKINLWVLTVDHEGFRKWYGEEVLHRIEE